MGMRTGFSPLYLIFIFTCEYIYALVFIQYVFINRSQVFEGHSHYVMQVIFNPKDTNTFASVSLDCSIKVSCIFSLLRFVDFCVVVYILILLQVWQLDANVPNFTLAGHEKGVNSIDYFQVLHLPSFINNAI